jgi:hypothetical protein
MYTLFWVPHIFLGPTVFIGVKNVSNKCCREPQTYNTVLFLVLQISRYLSKSNCNTASSPNLRNLYRNHHNRYTVHLFPNSVLSENRLCGLVVRVPGYRSRGPGLISGAIILSEK